jgi:Ca2+-binding EF-hand superfamily protein
MDFKNGCEELGLPPFSEDDLHRVFKRYDFDNSGTLKFSSFSHMTIPI